MDREADARIAEMAGRAALPRRSGELVFHDDWERRAFALAVALHQAGHYEWTEFQQQLIAAIAESERDDPLRPTRDYFESWLVSLETLLADRRLLD